MSYTLGLIKPNATRRKIQDEIFAELEKNKKFKITKKLSFIFTESLVNDFYSEHIQKPRFIELRNFMISGECIAFLVVGENAVEDFREAIGDTDPNLASVGTIRNMFADSKDENSIHGSDSTLSALKEMQLIFGDV